LKIDRESVPPRPVAAGTTFKLVTNAQDSTAVEWESSDAALAIVGAEGAVTAMLPGVVLITARLDDSYDVISLSIV
jgi:hypothetical protein